MSASATDGSQVDGIRRLPVNSEEQQFHDWLIRYKQSHILHSQCNTADKCAAGQDQCDFCVYTNTLALPHLPEMVFANNALFLTHSSGAQIEFNTLDALKQVCNGKLPLQVACADAWKESRDPQLTQQKIKPFDWTFSTDYRGTITGNHKVELTEERINIEKLKEKEKILFYHELMLYEDELHDNGIASCTVKIRVMPSSFFVLHRFFLRVDNVMVRVNDTRLYHEFNTNYVLREYTNKECGVKEVNLPLTLFGDPNALSPHMPLRTSINEKIIFECPMETPADSANSVASEKTE